MADGKIELDPKIVGRDGFREEVEAALASFEKEDRSFDCKRCGTHFEPAKQQWIFYELCDDCFGRFDTQKMRGGFPSQNIGKVLSFESVDEWISNELSQGSS